MKKKIYDITLAKILGNFEDLNHGGLILTNKPLGSGINLKKKQLR